jgi:hypothetical protein
MFAPDVAPEQWLRWASDLNQWLTNLSQQVAQQTQPLGAPHPLVQQTVSTMATVNKTIARGGLLVTNPAVGNTRPAFVDASGVARYYDGTTVA